MLRLLVLSLVGSLVLVSTSVAKTHGDNRDSDDQAQDGSAQGVVPADVAASSNKSAGVSTTMAPMNGSMNLTTTSVQINNPLPTTMVNSNSTNATMAPSNVTSTTAPSSATSPTAIFPTVFLTACGLVWLTHLS